MKLGSHVSVSGGLLGAAKEAASYGANTFMVYTGAPQNTIRKALSDLKIPEGKQFMSENGISDIVVHAPYIINMASFKEDTFKLAKAFLEKEIQRTAEFGSKYMVAHPGSYTEKDAAYGINRIAEALNRVFEKNDDDVIICLETMAGKGSEVGRNFGEIAEIIDLVSDKRRLGVCLDTCHVHDAGYDIVNDLDGVLDEFDKTLGLDLLHVIHLNGSLNEQGARKDRHANLGAGEDNPKGADKIGFEALKNVFLHEKLKDKIFILETPWLSATQNLYKEEIAALRELEK